MTPLLLDFVLGKTDVTLAIAAAEACSSERATDHSEKDKDDQPKNSEKHHHEDKACVRAHEIEAGLKLRIGVAAGLLFDSLHEQAADRGSFTEGRDSHGPKN